MLLKLSRDLYLHCQRFYCKVQTWALSRKEGETAGGDRNNSATMVDGSVPEREKKQGHQEGSKSCDNNRDGKRSLTKSIQSCINDGGRLFWKSGMEWRGEDWEDKDLNGGKEWRNTWGCWVWTKWMHRTEDNGDSVQRWSAPEEIMVENIIISENWTNFSLPYRYLVVC